MAEAVVSIILKQLALLLREEVRLVVGVDEEVEKLTSNFRAIQYLLRDAERKQFKDESVRDWLDKIKDVSYEIEDVLDEWNTAIQKQKIMEPENDSNLLTKVCSLIMSCFCLCCRPAFMRHDIARKIKRLTKTLDDIASERDMYHLSSINDLVEEVERPITTSDIDKSEIQGRDDVKGNIKSLLLSESSNGPTSPTIISIVGLGGLGKTTLARLVFNDDEVIAHFNMKIWVCVSDPFDEIRIGKAILESLKNAAPNVNEFEQVLSNIQGSIKNKKFLLVLDDVWTQDPNKWEQLKITLKHGSKESRVLVTTRNMAVADVLDSTHKIQLEKLSDQGSWSLFSRVAFSRRTNEECQKFEDIGRKIVEKCKGLPLAVKTLGSLLHSKNTIEEWQCVLDSEMWEIDDKVEKGIFRPLLLSYIDLPFELKRCFSYCAIFPKDYDIHKDQLIKLWMAQGYLRAKGNKDMELVGEEYFEKLAMRSFFQDFNRNDYGSIIRCKMHDMVHDMAQYLTKNECFSVEVESTEGFQLNRNAHHSMIVLKREASFPISIFDGNRLRSLVFDCDGWGSEHMYIDTSKLFDHMSCVRALQFCRYSIKDVSIDVNRLIHLRYLEISINYDIKELPETVCELYNLQTLNIDGCRNLKKLPEGIGKLVNLRHLINFDCLYLEYMLKGMERLTCLRTLGRVVVSGDKKACKFECLRNLNHLGGKLWMKCSGGVDVGEINKAEFKNRTKLLYLTIDLSSNGVSNTNEEALEDFQPPPNLEKLELRGYRGASHLSLNWMMSLRKLRKLTLRDWSGFGRLSLAKLPFLESLSILWMESVKSVGDEFVGMESDNISSFSSSPLVIAFPKLQSLLFDSLQDWEEWDCRASGRGEEQIKIMPCLRSLKISWCLELKTLPDYLLQSTTLEELDIDYCPNLGRRYKVEKAENWVKGSGIPKIRIYENPMFSDDLESSSPSVVSFHDDVEDELPETQTETAHISAIHSFGDDLESSSSSSLVADNLNFHSFTHSQGTY